ncbi:gluconeogenesis factor YvcK family protein [Tepidibacter aestuarii]|uniref:gluconeogenesis factor YvcK family protein n=1 Tax=Tepidibacter aestuarii TaxID=2925782 RepID=UPI0020C0CFF7|nr:gluconeogenesis factor YvcK family protein [Tepidibacter aestuarii]CAH2214843.1 metabolic checkpoint regulator; gluconeogenesis morphogenetic factor (UDP-GlcNAc binding) [Tepidibacter aestuarii]
MYDLGVWLAVIGIIFLLLATYLNYETIKKRKLLDKAKRGPKVVVIGGGTGQSIFLRGLKKFTNNITAVVTVADDGGGSGVLREDLGMLPPGDIRNCILALANMEPTMEKVMQYRFEEGKLEGQSFGNLFLAAMNGIYGNLEVAVSKVSDIFALTGKVYPVTIEDISLVAELKNGNIARGESRIPDEVRNQDTKIDRIYLEPNKPKPLQGVLDAIEDADIIVIGPGSLYTSIIPNLIVDGVANKIVKSDALKVYISNIMTQPGETDGYDVCDHVNSILKHTKNGIIDLVIANNEKINRDDLIKYENDGSNQVLIDKKQIKQLNSINISVIQTNLVEVRKKYIRHNSEKMGSIIVGLTKKSSCCCLIKNFINKFNS